MADSPPPVRNPDFDWVPRPDPTLLTNEAIERVTIQYRRELRQQQEMLDLRISNLVTLLDERYATQTKALDAAFVAAEKAVATALDSAERSVTKAEAAADKRFEAVNEFREQLTDQARTFLPRGEYIAQHTALEDKLATTDERLNALELRITSRLDTLSSLAAGAAGQRGESREDKRDAGQAVIMAIMAISVLLAIGSFVAFLLKK